MLFSNMIYFVLFSFIALSCVVDTKHIPLAIPAILQDMIPKETRDNLDSLTTEQQLQLEQAFRKYGANATAISNELEKNHPDLAKKVTTIMSVLENKVEKMTPKGRQYIESIIRTLQQLKSEKDLKPTAKQLILDWNDLDQETKKSVEKQFPSIPKVLKSEKFQKIANMKLNHLQNE